MVNKTTFAMATELSTTLKEANTAETGSTVRCMVVVPSTMLMDASPTKDSGVATASMDRASSTTRILRSMRGSSTIGILMLQRRFGYRMRGTSETMIRVVLECCC